MDVDEVQVLPVVVEVELVSELVAADDDDDDCLLSRNSYESDESEFTDN